MGFGWSNTYLIVNRGDTVEWSWSSFDVNMKLFYKVEQVESSISTKKAGFSSGNPTSSGTFLYQFNKLGLFHYWSGYINNDKFSFRGTVRVEDSLDKQLDIEVETNGFKGFFYSYFQNYSNSRLTCNYLITLAHKNRLVSKARRQGNNDKFSYGLSPDLNGRSLLEQDELVFSYDETKLTDMENIHFSSDELIFPIKNKTNITSQIKESSLAENSSISYEVYQTTLASAKNMTTETYLGEKLLNTTTKFEEPARNSSPSIQDSNFSDEIEFSFCNGQELDYAPCNFDTQSFESKILFTSCNVPTLRSISPKNITYDSLITIKGQYFSKIMCENEVYINGILCRLYSSSSTELTCKIGIGSGLIPNKFYEIEVLIKNQGYALHTDFYEIAFLPVVFSVSSDESKIIN
jgi:hypothetical protein